MKSLFAIVAACALLAPTTFTQGVPDGSDWLFPDGSTATIDVVDNQPGNGSVTIQITDATGSTSATSAVEGPDSTTDRPTCESSTAKTTPGGNTFKVTDSPGTKKDKLSKLSSDGVWIHGRPFRRKKGGVGTPVHMEPDYTGPGNVGSLPVAPKGP